MYRSEYAANEALATHAPLSWTVPAPARQVIRTRRGFIARLFGR